mmetsp:Transcript_8246/g.30412  ORF Transcript_8246/g.30412 Transcript_8246/m.30412 type:complete len:668 (-) Transcript_8246:118-2121(-)
MSLCPPFEELVCDDPAGFVGPLGLGCETNAPLCNTITFVGNGCPLTCGNCVKAPELPPTFGTCSTFIQGVHDLDRNVVSMFMATHVEVAGFQFSLFFDGIQLQEDVIGEGGLASQMDVSGGSTGNIVGVNVGELVSISSCSWNLLTELRLLDEDQLFPSGDLCVENIIVADTDGLSIPSFSYCEQDMACLSAVAMPQPVAAPDINTPSPTFMNMPLPAAGVCMPDPLVCEDTAGYEGPLGSGCAANAMLCLSFPQVAIDCPETCGACPDVPPPPLTFGGCQAFLDAVNEVSSISIFVGVCAAIIGFQFSLSIDDQLVVEPLEGSGGLAEDFAVSGIDGIVTGVALGDAEPIITSKYDLLTKLQVSGLGDFAEGVVCVTSIILENTDGDEVPSFSPCLLDAECLGGGVPPAPGDPVFVRSDPHFQGFRGQMYDVTGISDRTYSIIRDHHFQLNAVFRTAYTTGIFVDPVTQEVQKMRPKGTWMSSIGLVLAEASGFETHSLIITSEDSSHDRALCQLKPMECLVGGSVIIDGVETYLIGRHSMGMVGTAQLFNHKQFGRIRIVSQAIDLVVDFVLPPPQWEVAAEDVSEYTHLNLLLQKVALSDFANGLLGCSVRVKKDAEGHPIMRAYDSDGGGILEAPIGAYEVADVLDFTLPLYNTEWFSGRPGS